MVLAAAACGTTNTAQHIPIIPDTPQPIVGATLDPQAAPAPATTIPSAAKPAAAITGGKGLPVGVDIPAIGVHATHLLALGLNKDGSISTPPTSTPQTLGFYALSSPPCVPGPNKVPFTLVGHIDGDHKPGVFINLKNLKAGDTVTVALDTGKSCTYRISQLAEHPKSALTSNKTLINQVFGPTPSAAIRVISCGGALGPPPQYYVDDLDGMGSLVS